MENTKDLFQIKVDEAKENLSPESIEAIKAVNWKLIILNEFNNKYNSDQLENLEIDTELLLCGLSNTENYFNELQKRMGLSKEETDKLLEAMDKNIFIKIQEELEKILNKEIEIPLPPYAQTEEKIPEPVVPKTEEGIYEKSGIEMMPEEILPNTEASEKKIKEEVVTEEKETTKKEDNILIDSGINVVEELPLPKEEGVIPTTETEQVMMDSVEHPESIAKNILMNKLKGSSMSETTVSDYSLPKMSTDKHEDSNTI